MLHASCHCGRVRLEIARRPRTLTECNCSICRRYGAQWAYYARKSVAVHCGPDALGAYLFRTGTFQYYRCGCVTHYARVNTSNNERIAVNARMMDPDDLAGIPVRRLDVRRSRS
jgi:hypothetical protein